MDPIEAKLNAHELECERRYGQFGERFAKLETLVSNNQKLVWAVFISIAMFELNAIFKVVGH